MCIRGWSSKVHPHLEALADILQLDAVKAFIQNYVLVQRSYVEPATEPAESDVAKIDDEKLKVDDQPAQGDEVAKYFSLSS